jgi:pilus assembly protein CpaC
MSVIRGGGPNTNPFAGDVANQGLAAEPFPQGSQLPPSSVISMISVPGEQQVMLKVRIAELKRNAVRQMGVSFDVDIGEFFLSSMLGGAGNALINGTFDEDSFNLILGMLEQHGVAKILAQPNLVTLSGKTATFIAGGQFAVPTVVGVGGAQAATTSFQGFGTQLTFTPTVLDKDRIRLQVNPQFSSINAENSVNGIFGVDTRGASTVVDLREGQVLAIAGLIQEQQSGARSRVPYLGAIPGLGLLFNDKNTTKEETELVMIVSPEIVHAMEPEEAPSLLPGMELTEPTDYDFFMRSQIEGRPNCNHRSTVWPKYRDQLINPRLYLSNYFSTENFYVQGPHGLSN